MAKEYSTLVGQARTAAKKARSRQAQPGREIAKATTDYGTAMGDVAGQAYRGLKARAEAARLEAQGRLDQAQSLQGAARVSSQTNQQGVAALQTAFTAQQARVAQGAAPGMISAKSAIAEANAYAERIGIDMKKMDWTAKAAVYQSVIDRNADMAKLAFQSHLDQQNMQFQIDLQNKAQLATELKGSPAVVSSVTSSMPSMIAAAQAYVNDENSNKNDPAAAAAAWVTTVTNDPVAQQVLAGVMTTLLAGVESHTTNGQLDGNWVRNLVVNSIHTQYPDYANDSTVTDALSNGVLSGMLLTGNVPGMAWQTVLDTSNYQSWALTPKGK